MRAALTPTYLLLLLQSQDATAAAAAAAAAGALPAAVVAPSLPQDAPPAAVQLVSEQWDALGKRLTRLEASVDAVPQVRQRGVPTTHLQHWQSLSGCAESLVAS